MFFFKKKDGNRINKRAEALILAAEKISRYRGDLFDETERERLADAVAAAKNASADGVSAQTANDALNALEKTLDDLGGMLSPRKKIPEWIELIVVAAILAGGIRAFFVQPFKIPTNSMFPTYNGMTAEICTGTESAAQKIFERIFRSASFYSIKSPADGEILIPLRIDATTRGLSLEPPERSETLGNIVNPGNDIFRIFVGSTPVPVSVPRDFSFHHSVLLEAFFPENGSEAKPPFERWRDVLKTAKCVALPDGTPALRTGKIVRAGENLLDFKILGGDMVLVDRVTCHFAEPDRGDPFVFRTRNIPGLKNIELYYIKRLAGKPGDILRVADKKLFVNGKPADFADAMKRNNAPTPAENYFGYFPTTGAPSIYSWQLTSDFRVPDGFYFALGDNSANSFDSRGWGGVPVNDVVGTARFVLYPFSHRWGFAE